MLKVVTAIEEDYSLETEAINTKVFIAGGIKNCPDWQTEIIKLIKQKNVDFEEFEYVTLFNPRRAHFPDDPNTSVEQIVWEFKHLEEADIILYWFSRGTVNPISLFELGKYLNTDKKIVIGIDPLYEKKNTVEIQVTLERPNLEIVYSLEELVEELEYVIRRIRICN